jgi:hypothetical protein
MVAEFFHELQLQDTRITVEKEAVVRWTNLGLIRADRSRQRLTYVQSGAPPASPWGGILSKSPSEGRGSSRRVGKDCSLLSAENNYRINRYYEFVGRDRPTD